MSETLLGMAERHVRDGEVRLAHQEAIVAELDRDGHQSAAAKGYEVLETMRESLRLAREHLADLRQREAAATPQAPLCGSAARSI